MAIAIGTPAGSSVRRGLDLSWPVFGSLAVVLVVLVLLPLFWLAFSALSAREGSFTLGNFVALVADPPAYSRF